MGQNCERFIQLCLNGVKDADTIIYCDGGCIDNTLPIIKAIQPLYTNIPELYHPHIDVIYNKYNQEDLGMNGKQRNFYLNYLKTNYPNDWCLALDADEVVEDLSQIKQFIQNAEPAIYSVRMRHLIGDLSHEDSIQEIHPVLNRLFKISEAQTYPEVEHPVLQGNVKYQVVNSTIWHLAYIPNMWEIKKRYDNHLKKSNIHTTEYLYDWYKAHLFGTYPRKEFNPVELPKVILDKFGIDKDEFYFKDRIIDLKHPIMVKQWFDYFKPESVLDLGCGRGPYLYFWNWFVNDSKGVELSEYAAQNAFIPDRIAVGDVTDEGVYKDTDLITAVDVLEHLDNEQLDKALKNIVKYGKRFLFSVPVIGDQNLENDKTHKQFKTRGDWIKTWESYGIKIKDTPDHWYFKHQLFIGEHDRGNT